MIPRPHLHVRLAPYDMAPGTEPPRRGDYIRTVTRRGDGSAYMVLKIRKVARRGTEFTKDSYVVHGRRVETTEIPAGVPVFWLKWYQRKKC